MEGSHISQAALSSTRAMRTTFLPFALPHITQAEIDEVVDTLRSGWLTTGLKTKRFEKEFAQIVMAPYAVAVNSATAAMHLALDAIGIQAGDEVIVPVYTFTATAEVVVHCRANPIFVDVDPITCNLDPRLLEKSITARTRAIIVVDIAGLPAEMDQLRAIAQAHQLPIIEDAAHAFPAAYRGQMVGSINELTAFSFYATKTLTTGEGGMLTTANPEYAQRASLMALHGIRNDAWNRYAAGGSWYYEVVEAGYKYNMTDIAASLGLHQLARSAWLCQRRQDIAQRYTQAFALLPELSTPPDPLYITHAWHLYLLRLQLEDLTLTRADFIRALTDAKIGTSVHFIPLHLHPFYRNTYHLAADTFPAALQAYQETVSLPIYPAMTDDDVTDVIATVTHIIKTYKKCK